MAFYGSISEREDGGARRGGALAVTASFDSVPGNASTTFSVTPGGSTFGYINSATDKDWFRLSVYAGQTYSVAITQTQTADGLDDAYLRLFDRNGFLIGSDDDSGPGFGAFYTFTATYTGVVYVEASGFDGATGRYAAEVFTTGGGTVDSVPGDATTSRVLTVGQTGLSGAIDSAGDADWYRVQLQAGKVYEFDLLGDLDADLDPLLEIRDASGAILDFNDDFNESWDSSLSFVAPTTGTYFLAAQGFADSTGGYELSGRIVTTGSPVDSLGLRAALPTAAGYTVYFAVAGETIAGETSVGWSDAERAQVVLALQRFTDVTGVPFTVAGSAASATFQLVLAATLEDEVAYFYPPESGSAGVGVFAKDGFGWATGLNQGGYGFATLLHELGHGFGLGHPHEQSFASLRMVGVNDAFGSYGWFDLNQGVYTTMGYNDGAPVLLGAPAAPDRGHQASYMALDVAMLQRLYGANTGFRTGDDVYVAPVANGAGTVFLCLWDAGGHDTLSFADATAACVIDLTAATLDYSATGGGVLSYVSGVQGGFTIAAGVVIEAAMGGHAADRIVGNGANNQLVGGSGSDTLIGGDGADTMRGDGGLDSLVGGAGNDLFLVWNDLDQVVEAAGGGFDAVWTDLAFVLPDHVEKLVSATGFGVELTGNGLDNEVTGNNGADVLRGLAGSDVMEGNGGADLIYGGLGVDLIRGGAGHDRLVGEEGVDLAYGGAGDDIFFVFNEADQVFEYADEGFDTVFTDLVWTAGAHVEKVVSATQFAVLLTGNALGNELVGNGGNDTLLGLDGSDILEGRGGDDLLQGGAEGDGLYGFEGNDTLDGGLGNDFLFGAAGSDKFLVKGEGVDTLAGFIAGEDDVVLSAALYGAADSGGGVARLVVGPGAVATTARATLLFDPSTGRLFYDADGDGAGQSVLLARFTGDLAAFSVADLIFGP